MLKRENDILLWRLRKKQVLFNIYDKLFFVVLNRADDIEIEYLPYSLVSVRTGRGEAPSINGIMERFFRTVRREALDNFLLTGKNQVQRSWTNMSRSIMVSNRIRGAATDSEAR